MPATSPGHFTWHEGAQSVEEAIAPAEEDPRPVFVEMRTAGRAVVESKLGW